jgi:alanine racemase
MAAAASNTHGALLTLVLNGYGHDAMKVARSLFEIEINIIRLKAHPDEIEDFLVFCN